MHNLLEWSIYKLMNGKRRVVITGRHLPTGSEARRILGRADYRTLWDRPHHPIRRQRPALPDRGEIPNFVPEDYMDRKEARRVPRACQLALAGAIEA